MISVINDTEAESRSKVSSHTFRALNSPIFDLIINNVVVSIQWIQSSKEKLDLLRRMETTPADDPQQQDANPSPSPWKQLPHP